jgi:hypothetical protein
MFYYKGRRDAAFKKRSTATLKRLIITRGYFRPKVFYLQDEFH